MIYKFFETQLEKRNKKDWVNTVENDLKEIGLENLNFDCIKTMSKLSFKKSIKEKIQKTAFEKLIRRKEMHSKVKHIKYETLEMSDYLKPSVDQVCKEEAQLIFKIRCRVTNVKVNQRGKYYDLNCRICKEEEESQEHLLICKDLETKTEIENVNYEKIFNGTVEEKLRICKKVKSSLKMLEKINP